MPSEEKSPAVVKQDLDPNKASVPMVRDMLMKMKDQISMALPKHMTPDRLIRVALTSVQKTPALLECAPITLVGAVVQAAQLGLEPDDGTGKAYLIPFWNSKKNRREVQFMPGYKGLVELARRSGEIRDVIPRVVHENDEFDYELGLNTRLVHKPKLGDRGKPIAYYAVATYKDNAIPSFDVMSIPEIDAIRKQSKASGSGPWETHYDEMAKKTVVRRLCKYLPSSPELQKAIALDERADVGLPQDLGAFLGDRVSDDPEATPMPGRASEAVAPKEPLIGPSERENIRALLAKHKIELKELDAVLEKKYGYTGTQNIRVAHYAEVVGWIEDGGQMSL